MSNAVKLSDLMISNPPDYKQKLSEITCECNEKELDLLMDLGVTYTAVKLGDISREEGKKMQKERIDDYENGV